MRESTFWKSLAWLAGAVLVTLILIDALGVVAVAPQPRAFLFSILFCIAVGYSVISSRSSPVLAGDQAERAFRRRQLQVGLVFSVVLGMLLLVPEVREASVSWLLVPVIALAPVLILREIIIRARNARA